MIIKFKCGCGQYNYNLGDWIAHFKYGISWVRALHLLAQTKIEIR